MLTFQFYKVRLELSHETERRAGRLMEEKG